MKIVNIEREFCKSKAISFLNGKFSMALQFLGLRRVIVFN